MRIVLLNQYYTPAEAPTAVLAADLLEALARRGHEVHAIASSRAYNDPSRTYPRREEIGGVSVWRTRTSGFGRGGKTGRLIDYLTFLVGSAWRLYRLPRPDLVISMTTPPMLCRVVLPICRRRDARLLYWAMDLYPDVAFALGVLRADGWLGRWLSRAAERAIVGADHVVALGPAMARRLAEQGASHVEVIDNWCDGDAIRPRDKQGHPHRLRNGWEGKFVVLYSGNMGLAHEFDTLLDA
nr:glycosyltransferase [Acidobacteriota bacterium]NIQ86046.1 glycosyltransferase [Acidobacteriota bacterium]